MKRLIGAIGLLSMMVLAPLPSLAQNYPQRPVKIIVPLPAGGPTDALARLLGKSLGESLGQPFVVENRPGANTIIGAQAAAEAPADGYTLFMATDSTLSINPHLYAKLSYDPAAFVAVSQLVTFPGHLMVNVQVPVTTLKEFIDYAHKRPGELNFGSYGPGSSPHLSAERFMMATGVKMLHVPFKGSSDSMAAFASNLVQVNVASAASGLPLVRAGKVRPLAASGKRRAPVYPDTPTFAESGFPDLNFLTWFGLVAPKGTPDDIVKRIADLSAAYVNSPEFVDTVAPRYARDPVGNTPAEFADFLVKDRAAYGELVRHAKIPTIN